MECFHWLFGGNTTSPLHFSIIAFVPLRAKTNANKPKKTMKRRGSHSPIPSFQDSFVHHCRVATPLGAEKLGTSGGRPRVPFRHSIPWTVLLVAILCLLVAMELLAWMSLTSLQQQQQQQPVWSPLEASVVDPLALLFPATWSQKKDRVLRTEYVWQHLTQGSLRYTYDIASSTDPRTVWCPMIPETHHHAMSQTPPPPKGLLFAKTIKTASSTAAAVTMRLARRVGQRLAASSSIEVHHNQQPLQDKTTHTAVVPPSTTAMMCPHMYVHAHSYTNQFSQRDSAHSFLWTMVRHPQTRAMSAYKYFQLATMGQVPSPEALVAYLEATKDQMLQQLRMDRPRINEALGILTIPDKNNHNKTTIARQSPRRRQPFGVVEHRNNPLAVAHLIQETVQQYNFIAVSERMEESLIVLLVLLGLLDTTTNGNNDDKTHDRNDNDRAALTDLIVLPSKQAGEWEENAWAGRPELLETLQNQGLPRILTEHLAVSNRGCITLPKDPIPFWPLQHHPKDQSQNDTLGAEPSSSMTETRQAIQSYLESNYAHDNMDFLLYKFANRLLDDAIERLVGHSRMKQLVDLLREMQIRAQDQCGSTAIFPCSRSGHRQSRSQTDCYAADMGCGFRCIDTLFPLSNHTAIRNHSSR